LRSYIFFLLEQTRLLDVPTYMLTWNDFLLNVISYVSQNLSQTTHEKFFKTRWKSHEAKLTGIPSRRDPLRRIRNGSQNNINFSNFAQRNIFTRRMFMLSKH